MMKTLWESILDKRNKKDTKIGQIVSRLTQWAKEDHNELGFRLKPDESLNISLNNGVVEIQNTYQQAYHISMDQFLELQDLGVTGVTAKYEWEQYSTHVDVHVEQGTISNRVFKGEICRHLFFTDGVVTFKNCKFENDRININSPFDRRTVRFENCEFNASVGVNFRMCDLCFKGCKFNTPQVTIITDMNSFDWKNVWNKFILNTKKDKSLLKDIGLDKAPDMKMVVAYERWKGVAPRSMHTKGTLLIRKPDVKRGFDEAHATEKEVDGYMVSCWFGDGPSRKDKLAKKEA